MTRIALLFTGLMLLSACGPLMIRDAETGRYAPIGTGAFELHRDVTLPPGRARLFFQGGDTMTRINEFRPHCQLEVDRLSESPQLVRADLFRVTGVSTRSDQVVQSAPLQLAGLGSMGLGAFDQGDGGESRRMFAYIFKLQSDRQPQVRSLVCAGAFDDPGLAQRPTLQEIATSLGKFGTLTLQ